MIQGLIIHSNCLRNIIRFVCNKSEYPEYYEGKTTTPTAKTTQTSETEPVTKVQAMKVKAKEEKGKSINEFRGSSSTTKNKENDVSRKPGFSELFKNTPSPQKKAFLEICPSTMLVHIYIYIYTVSSTL